MAAAGAMATGGNEPQQCVIISPSCLSWGRRSLVIRCRTRNAHIGFAVLFAFLALGAAIVYQRPVWQARAYVTFKRMALGYGLVEKLGVGDPGREMILNRKGLQVPKDPLAGRKPVSMTMTPEVILDYIGESFYRLFLSADTDDDEYLDPGEFARLLERIEPIRNFAPEGDRSAIKGGSGSGSGSGSETERMVTLRCEFDPLHLDTITKDLTPESGTNLHYLSSLLNWTRPHRCPISLPESLLIAGLRPPPGQPLGQPYYLTKRPDDAKQSAMWNRDEFDYESAHSINRHNPPSYSRPGARAISALLSAFHAGSFASTRHPPHSSVALVRAIGADFVDVAFRVHAEFQLASPPRHPFWFTPSFWFGHATFSRDLSRLLLLDMDIPEGRKLNVDMEWIQEGMGGLPDEEVVEVDIGHTSAMRLCTENACDRRPKEFGQYEHQLPGPPESPEQQLSFDRAFAQLEVELYPFKRVPYLPFPEAFRRANLEGRLVHTVVLWGSLDDQSC